MNQAVFEVNVSDSAGPSGAVDQFNPYGTAADPGTVVKDAALITCVTNVELAMSTELSLGDERWLAIARTAHRVRRLLAINRSEEFRRAWLMRDPEFEWRETSLRWYIGAGMSIGAVYFG